MAHVSSGRNVGQIHMGGVLSSVAPILESQGWGSKFSGSKDGRLEGGGVGYGLCLIVLYVNQALVPRYLVKHQSRCCHGSIY